ncbi:secreted protein [gut metagenome]|uniref:Secreted protein n=1 Tax=gut metagenome TaxID=749906 RepID=J9FCT9_9ZZZZ
MKKSFTRRSKPPTWATVRSACSRANGATLSLSIGLNPFSAKSMPVRCRKRFPKDSASR